MARSYKQSRGGFMGQASRQAAADIYHNNLENTHDVCEKFRRLNNLDSLNKLRMLLSQLHGASGAQYIYGTDNAEHPNMWLCDNGKTILNQLITDAETSALTDSASVLRLFMKELEAQNLIN